MVACSPGSSAVSHSSPNATPRPCSDVTPPQFPSPATSDRNLEVVQFKGSGAYMVRDITDILHPVTLATFTAQNARPQFVSGGEVSFIDAAGLELMQVAGSSKHLVTRCAQLFAWSPDGTTLAFVTENEEMHLVRDRQNRLAASMPTWPGGFACASQSCADSWESALRYSPNGASISLIQYLPGVFRIWTSDGTVLAASDFSSTGSAGRTMSVWSGDTFYFRDPAGVEKWKGGTQTVVLPGVGWIRPHASPAGGQIVYGTRDAAGIPRPYLLDTATGKVRALSSWRSEPVFLNTHLIWYQEERACLPTDRCIAGPTTLTGRTFVYDLADGTEIESPIASVADVWPHPA